MRSRIVTSAMFALLGITFGWAGCAGEDPDVRRGNMLYQNHEYDAAFKMYEKAVTTSPKNLDLVRKNMKNAYYYYGGSLESGGSLEAAVKYYEKGFALEPTEIAICDKLAKFYWGANDFDKAANYFHRLVELDGEAPDTEQKWSVMGDDYYALGYSLTETKKYQEAIDAFKSSLKVAPKGGYAAKCKEAIAADTEKMKK